MRDLRPLLDDELDQVIGGLWEEPTPPADDQMGGPTDCGTCEWPPGPPGDRPGFE